MDKKRGDGTGSGIVDISMQSDSDKLEKAEEFYSTFLYFVDNLFIMANVSDELDLYVVTEKIKSMVEYIKENRRFLVRIIKNIEPAPGKSYLASHSVRSTILAIIIGTYLKLPQHRLIDRGVAALVHEVGMLKLPSHLYLSDKPLSDQDKKSITAHPIIGYNILKSHDFPAAICVAALEHHERENGSGYPRHVHGDKITLYSKIIAVVCSYEALSSKRPHKEAKDGYTGMLELLKNEGKRYDDTVVKALVVSLSIYPIGLYVLLSNGKKGQVVDVNPESPRFPIVQIFGEFTPDGKVKIAQTEPDVLSIVRPLNPSEIEN
jgi:HD-GYP domain-containing protein (c-di-GMP phosphodiesterase class II)